MTTAPKLSPATIEDFLRVPPDARVELIRGTIVEKPQASTDHAAAQSSTSRRVGDFFQRKPGGHFPGGWWFFTELKVRFGEEVHLPDICAYRRERMPEIPKIPIISLAPDWVCELISPSHEGRDRVVKSQTYARAGVPHYWIMNSLERTLEVFRRTEIGYALVQSAQSGDRIRPEPFQAVEFRLDELFGDDPEDE